MFGVTDGTCWVLKLQLFRSSVFVLEDRVMIKIVRDASWDLAGSRDKDGVVMLQASHEVVKPFKSSHWVKRAEEGIVGASQRSR